MGKKFVLVDSSPRVGGNSEVVVDLLGKELTGAEVTVFKMREKNGDHVRHATIALTREKSAVRRMTM